MFGCFAAKDLAPNTYLGPFTGRIIFDLKHALSQNDVVHN